LVERDRFKKESLLKLSRLVEVQLVAVLNLLEIEYPESIPDPGEGGLGSE
jgi:hypothetical protein